MTFLGFDRAAITLLSELPRFGKTEYAKHSELLSAGLREPGLQLIQAVAEAVDPSLTADRHTSVSPLHRDLRFAAIGTPHYKDHLLLTTWEGREKKIAPTLWIRIDSEFIGFASGIAMSPEIRERWRLAVGGPQGQAFAQQIAVLQKAHSEHEFEAVGDTLKRVPPPWDEKHPRADLLRMNRLQVRFRERIPKVIDRPAFAEWCEQRLLSLIPVHRWLVTELAGRGVLHDESR